MFQMQYSCTVKCADGVTRTYENSKFFVTKAAFEYCLSLWDGCAGPNGGAYSYFVTDAQFRANAGAKEYRGVFKWDDFCIGHSPGSGFWCKDREPALTW